MKKQSLNGAWTLDIPGSAFESVPARVPGSVYHDLLTAEIIPDPFYRDNELQALQLMENEFHYRRSFTADAELLKSDRVLLRCEGLDTLAEIYLNDRLIGRADNMHRIWEFDAKGVLHEEENRIEVRFASPTKYIREAYAASRADGSSDAMRGFPLLRKAHCMFGWDWGPRLPDAGIWRDISLLGMCTARIRDVLILQEHAGSCVKLRVRTSVEHVTQGDAQVLVRVTGPDGTQYAGRGEDCEILIQNPQLWWPAGFGGQPLYQVTVELENTEDTLDIWQRRIGLRTMTVTRRRDEWGESFCHTVNGVDIFAMGADYIPEDRNVFSYVMEKHQRNSSANGRIVFYLSQMYRYPADLGSLVYASQLLQAQAMQYGVEHWRRNRGRCMGAVIWQLNDCWPVASWSSIDYFGRWKALHYYARRFFAPVLISCHEEGILSQDMNVNAEPFALQKSARLNVSNETSQHFSGTVRWSLRRPDASVIEAGCFPVEVPALSTVWLPKQDFSAQDSYGCYYAYALCDAAGSLVGEGSVLFCPPKHFRFADPKLCARREGDEIVVSAEAYARSVEICCGADVVLEDNYFDMNAGERRVRILRGEPGAIALRSVYDIGRV